MLIKTQAAYAYEYENAGNLNIYLLRKTGYEVNQTMLTAQTRAELDCLAAVHIQTPEINELCPNLRDCNNPENVKYIQGYITKIFHEVAMLYPTNIIWCYEQTCKRVMLDYVMACRRDQLVRAMCYEPQYANLRGTIMTAMRENNLNVNEVAVESVIEHMADTPVDTPEWSTKLAEVIEWRKTQHEDCT